ncbi:uncharacterized protein BXIN_2669 [Babesia sp. Xinjiang]|uniref:uncharacterized protein n=1 Tax=Babesia sp. Xinjiang TaxID=462227 RepID=UPI000A25E479|nr:uncharacterized protein BXIN_2652 [Babesia sp. Xinjiang]XP_028872079.1 uncharacterized protein BXIN_2669 [Babesia sp. Xinjiang]ORM41542.1 hypothetical protein BXIN_2652 [Babesia sp. Xinjiang]ORM41623.1 hypothetical protein BXIN_2669 [Babesia sp. Xinjiang]
MHYCRKLEALLPKLKLLSRQPPLCGVLDDGSTIAKAARELKLALTGAINENSVSDETIIQAADCLYDLNAVDVNIGAHICRAVEHRPGIYRYPLKGGILWSFHHAGKNSARRKKMIKSSSRATMETFIDALGELQGEEPRTVLLRPIMRNMAIVGQCHSFSVSAKARLEQAIMDAKEGLSNIMTRSSIILGYIVALKWLRVRNHIVATDAIQWLLAAISYQDVLTTAEVTKAISALQTWCVTCKGKPYKAIEILVYGLTQPPSLLMKSTPALVKFYIAATKVSRSNKEGKRSIGIITYDDDTDPSADHNAEEQQIAEAAAASSKQPKKVADIAALTVMLLTLCCSVINRFNARNLVLLYNAMSHHFLLDGLDIDRGNNFLRCIKLVSTEVCYTLQLDATAHATDSPLRPILYTEEDLGTIYRASMILSRAFDGLWCVTDLVEKLLIQRYGPQYKRVSVEPSESKINGNLPSSQQQ